MSKLRTPLKRLLDTPLSEPQLQHMWRELQQRRLEPKPRQRRAASLAASAVALVLAAVGVRMFFANSRVAAGPLTVQGRAALAAAETLGGVEPQQLDFDDGSQIALDASARISVLENSGQRVVLHLQRGRGNFEVHPGGPRRWSIECGLATVEVIGTRFSIDRRAGAVRVAVVRGTVLVRGEGVPDRVRRLVAGEALDVRGPEADSAAGRAAGPASSNRAAEVRGSQSDGTAERAAVASSPNGSADAPRASAPDAPLPLATQAPRPGPFVADGGDRSRLEPGAPEPSAQSGAADRARRSSGEAAEEEWLAAQLRAADRARSEGRAARAAVRLRRVMQRAPGSAYAALAALSLARMQLEHAPAEAALSLRSALAANMPESLREDAMASLVEAYARSRQSALAREAAEAYDAVFPSGRRSAEVRDWAAQR